MDDAGTENTGTDGLYFAEQMTAYYTSSSFID